MEILRATRTSQQAAAYYVRIQAMARKHQIPLDVGSLVVKEAEAWAKELGYETAVLESRDNKIQFYEQMGYVADMSTPIVGETFTCYRMEKTL